MIVYDTLEQGTDEWLRARLSKPTASMFDRLITSTGKASTQADAYMNTLIAEWLTGLPGGMEPTPWMQRGTELEPEARAFYEMDRGAEVKQVGFVSSDCGRYGCSPDGLVDGNGLEIKCPSPAVHVEYMLGSGAPGKYKAQLQGQIMVCEWEWVDFLSYHPNMPPVCIRVERDQGFIDSLSAILDAFLDRMSERKEKLIQKGVEPVMLEDA